MMPGCQRPQAPQGDNPLTSTREITAHRDSLQCQGASGPKLHKETIHSPAQGRRLHTETAFNAKVPVVPSSPRRQFTHQHEGDDCTPRQPALPLKQAVLHEKMLSIPNHQRNANQNHNEVSPHTPQNGHHQRVYREFPGSQGVWVQPLVGELRSHKL